MIQSGKSSLAPTTRPSQGLVANTASSRPTPIDYLNSSIYRGKDDNENGRWSRYFEPVPELSRGLPIPILGIMVLIWQLREKDLQKKYSLKTRKSRLQFIGWCIVHGRREYRSLQDASLLWEALNQPVLATQMPEDDPVNGLSWLITLAATQRPDLRIDLTRSTGRKKLLAWYLLHGRVELGFDGHPLEDWQVRHLLSPSRVIGLNNLQKLVYDARPDVRKAFPLRSSKQQYLAWFKRFITEETKLIEALRSKPVVSERRGQVTAPVKPPPGVNIIGYAFAQMGIGEDARMAAKSLLAAHMPINMVNFPPGGNVPQEDQSMAAHVGDEPKYSTNIFCLTALEHGRCLAELGFDYIRGRRSIGYWPWELPSWPDKWMHLFSLVDEIWVSSRHTCDAVRPNSPVPVRLMPMAVDATEVSNRDRDYFGLPRNAKLFFFAFDLNSSTNRKNPEACVAAFLKAFPPKGRGVLGADEVGLVIKVHPPKSPNKAWNSLKRLQRCDQRIHLIEKTLSKADLLALYKVCDSFISLHRAEGFGRCIAEAMLLGKPVIVTGYSGNLTFTNVNNALLVKHKLRPVARFSYPYADGQSWAEPDINDAARQMRRLFRNASLAEQLGAAGKATISKHLCISKIGKRYMKRMTVNTN